MDWDSATNQEELIKYLEERGYLWELRVRDVLRQVDRGNYCKGWPYIDNVNGIGFSAFIDAPHMHAYALQKLERHLVEGAVALDVGAGSGYLSVCMALMVGARGRVLAIEHLAELASSSEHCVRLDKPHLLRQGKLKFVVGDGREGYSREAPYDAIYVGAAACEIPPKILDQLAPGGRMLIPVGAGDVSQTMVIVDKDHRGRVTETLDISVKNMPLSDVKTQMGPFQHKDDAKAFSK